MASKKILAKRSATARAKGRSAAKSEHTAFAKFVGRELKLELPRLGAMSPGLAWIHDEPEVHADADGDELRVIGTNMAGLWFALAGNGSIHLVDDVERELGLVAFANIGELVNELRRQNG